MKTLTKKTNPMEEKFLTLIMNIIINGGIPIWNFLVFVVGGNGKKN